MNKLSLYILLILVLGLSIPSEGSAQCGRVRSVVKNTSAKAVGVVRGAAVTAKGVVLETVKFGQCGLVAGRNVVYRVVARPGVVGRAGVCNNSGNCYAPTVATGTVQCGTPSPQLRPIAPVQRLQSVLERTCTSGTCVK